MKKENDHYTDPRSEKRNSEKRKKRRRKTTGTEELETSQSSLYRPHQDPNYKGSTNKRLNSKVLRLRLLRKLVYP